MTFEILETETRGTIIKVVGVGGAGGNAVQHMIARNVQGVEFICANTDHQALARSTARNILQLGKTGLGAGQSAGSGSRSRRGSARSNRRCIARCAHGVHHRGYGRRYRHRRSTGGGADREGSRHSDSGGGIQTVRV